MEEGRKNRIKKSNQKSIAPVRLRYNKKLKFLENEAFDENLIKYNSNYDNNQSYSNRFKTHLQNVYNIIDKHLKYQYGKLSRHCLTNEHGKLSNNELNQR